MDLRFLDPNGQPTREAFNERFSRLNDLINNVGNEYVWEKIGSNSTLIGYVNSPDPNAYPPAVSDGATYTPLGQLGEKVRVETGSYTGTGKYGSSNKSSLTFGFVPKLVVIYPESNGNASLYFWGTQYFLVYGTDWLYKNTVSVNGKTMTWYMSEVNVGNAYEQHNAPGVKYHYLAIG